MTTEQWFSIRSWDTQPVPVTGKVTKVTNHFVWIDGQREQRA